MNSKTLGKFAVVGAAMALTIGFTASGNAFAARGGTHFKASGPDFTSGDAGDELRTPLDFERAAAAAKVGPSALILYSRCRNVSGNQIGPYAPIAPPEADVIVHDTQFSYADGTSCYNPQNESNIVANPSDPLNLVTSANEYRIDGHVAYYSKDGGVTWNNIVLPGWTSSTGGKGVFAHLSSFGDPVLAFSSDGSRLYYSGLVGNSGYGGNQGLSGIAVAVSTDGGATWSAPRMVSYVASNNVFNDKEWMTVAPDGTVYLTWTRFFTDPKHGYRESPIVLSKSVDGGNTWSGWVKVSDASHPYDQGSNPVVGPDGTVYVAYEGATPGSGYAQDALVAARSTDGGATFTNAEVTRIYDDLDCYPIQEPGAQDRQTLSYEQFRINSFPNVALDPTIGTTGKISIVWADNRNHASCGHGGTSFDGTTGPTTNQVFLVTSTDGVTWSTPQQITTGTEDKVYPSIASSGGRTAIGYYTRAYSPTPTASDLSCARQLLDTSVTPNTAVAYPGSDSLQPVCMDYAARTSDSGFGSEVRVTAQSSNPYAQFAGSFIGDYTGMTLDSAQNATAVWTDSRGNPGVLTDSKPNTPNQDVLVGLGL
jgi:hypothetical protein